MPEGEASWSAAIEALGRVTSSSEEPVLVREGLSLLVRQGDALVRVRPRAQEPIAAREHEVAQALARAGVAAITSLGAGPVHIGNWVVTSWEWVDVVGEAAPGHLGALARDLRDRTAGTYAWEVARFDPLTAIRNAVAHVPVGDPQADYIRRRAHALSGGWAGLVDRDPAGTAIVHGDLHAGNVLVSANGPLLSDLELAGTGPCSYDTAPSVVGVERYGADPVGLERFIAAQQYDPRDWAGFATCVSIYELWGAAWSVGVRDRSPALAAEADLRVSCLRDQLSEPWSLF